MSIVALGVDLIGWTFIGLCFAFIVRAELRGDGVFKQGRSDD